MSCSEQNMFVSVEEGVEEVVVEEVAQHQSCPSKGLVEEVEEVEEDQHLML